LVKYLSDDLETMKNGVHLHMQAGHNLMVISAIFAIVGVVSDALNIKIILGPISWLLLAVVFAIFDVSLFIGWAVSWYLRTEAKSEKKE
jgi:hypothetical protein